MSVRLARLVPLLALLLCRDALHSPPAAGQGSPVRHSPGDLQVLVATFEFGAGGRDTDRFLAVRAAERDNRFGWYGRVWDRTPDLARSSREYSSVEGFDAVFMVGVSADSIYQLVLTIPGNRESGHLEVLVGDTVVCKAELVSGRPSLERFNARPVHGCLSFRLRSPPCGSFALSRLQIFGPAGAHLEAAFPGPDGRAIVPAIDSLTAIGRVLPRDQLRRYCEFLIDNEAPDGTFSYHGAWYENSFPLRTLLAGSSLLDEPAWRDTALKVLDRFISLQQPDGNWASGYSGVPGCGRGRSVDEESANLADIGTMTLCLAMAVPFVDETRAGPYLSAALQYSDSIALPSQLGSGAFPNRLWRGHYQTTPYSVATATQASSLALLHAVTGRIEYLKAAERASLWLADHVQEDGRFEFAPQDTEEVRLIEATDFGHLYYVMEALSITSRYTTDAAVRGRLDAAINRWIDGERGLAATAVNGYWWPPADLWSGSKMAAVPFFLARHPAPGRKIPMELWTARALAWLADPALSLQAGVMAHPAGPYGDYALPATGLAGIGVAAVIEPGILLPAPHDFRSPVAKVDH